MNDIKLHYIEQGSGCPLILLHGNGEDHHYFQAQLSFFSKHFRVIAVDTRGHGKSPRGEKPFALETFADDLSRLLDEKKIERTDLLGFSDGGNIAMIFALKYPYKVKRLILNGANLDPKGVKPAVQFPIALGYGLTALFSPFCPKAKANHEMLGLMVKQPHILPETLKKLTIPVLVIVGDHDMIKPEHSRLIAESLPNGEFCEIPGDHFIAAKNSALFNQKVAAFLNESGKIEAE